MWNQLIYKKYNSLVKIDETILKEELIKKLSSKKNMSTIYQNYYLKLKVKKISKINMLKS